MKKIVLMSMAAVLMTATIAQEREACEPYSPLNHG